jgi:molybdopterin biosynthesis enzyme
VLFTPASNILWTYMLPGLPAAALLAAELFFAGSAAAPKPKEAGPRQKIAKY